MQRKATKNTRGPNTLEKAFQGWLKERPCGYCGNPGPSIVDHARGATFKHQKTLIGHIFCTPRCERCDFHKTTKGRRVVHGKFESQVCIDELDVFLVETKANISYEIYAALVDFYNCEYGLYESQRE